MNSALLLYGVPIRVRHDRPPVEALAIVGDRVIAAGSLAHVRAAVPRGSTERALTGGALLPAFVDAHQHAFLVAADPYTDTLHGRSQDIDGLLDRLAELLATTGGGEGWARFHGYQPLVLAERRSPTAAELDRVSPDRPLHVISRTFHESAVNTEGLAALGIGTSTPDPAGGRIVRDRRGRPTGVLLEAASFTAEAASRAHEDPDAWRTRLVAHGRRLVSLGIVRIGDAAVPASVADDVVAELAAVGVTAHPLLVGDRIDEPALLTGGTGKVLADGGEYCHLCLDRRQVRAVMAASLRASVSGERALARAVGRRSGYPRKEADGRWHTGIRFPAEARMTELLRTAASAGSALAVHAVGNGAVAEVLASLERDPALAAAVPLRVEHALAIDPALAARLGALGLPVVAQPVFLPAFGHELDVVPVPAPLLLMPNRTLLDAGVRLVLSSDYPAADLNPWQGVAAAVDRLDGTFTAIHPNEAITLAEALSGYSWAGAQVLGAPEAGTLEPGMLADLIWVDADPYDVPIAGLGEIRVRATWAGGRQVHGDALPDPKPSTT
jgi:predicted amidohydrolase YtcJ